VQGGTLRKAGQPGAEQAGAAPVWNTPLPEPQLPALEAPWSILIGGIGGTGVVTIGQTLAMAAHIQGYYSSNLDITGLAQKYGAVHSHVRLAAQPHQLHATRIAVGEADTLIGCDLIVAAGDESVAKLKAGVSQGVVSTDQVPTAEFARNPDWQMDPPALLARLQAVLGDKLLLLDGLRLSRALLGDPIASNMFMLGAAWQRGQVPLALAAIERAIELNGVAVGMNRQAFLWGRRAAHDLAAVEQSAQARDPSASAQPSGVPQRSLEQTVALRAEQLVAHTGAALAQRYRNLVQRVRQAESAAGLGEALGRAVAENYHKLLAVKDEWEVARLYSHADFRAALEREFVGPYRLRFHIGAWPLGRFDAASGKHIKREAGPWVLTALRWMSHFKGLRGSLLDPFRHSAERQLERSLLAQYEADLAQILACLDARRHATAVQLAALPQKVRGYGHVRQASADGIGAERAQLLAALAQAE
ncbi:MAG: DUF6537 domain-containing protein, partial [Rhodoferax sp.]